MAQSLFKLYIHIIFCVKTTFKQIRKEDRNELYAYIGSVIKQNDSTPIAINGMSDHISFLCQPCRPHNTVSN
ncbi:MAG: transposase [Dysgonamonadaceae bacterium]|nr:transposase [Dysgonamonadaceae bacterium]